jgi:oxidase EvaA
VPSDSRRLALSAAAGEGVTSDAEVRAWIDERRLRDGLHLERTTFDALPRWSTDPATGDVSHDSGGFFAVRGMDVRRPDGSGWQQPVVVQPEVGILGMVVREIDGLLHCLVQAKVEPGNPGAVQLSPTVQATRSNYTRLHHGATVRHLEHFLPGSGARTVSDSLQSEHGTWFWRKRNRNVVVEVDHALEDGEDHRWLTVGQVQRFLREDDTVNMCTRTVLAGAPLRGGAPAHDEFTDALAAGLAPGARSRHSDAEVRAWFTAARVEAGMESRLVPLGSVQDWVRTPEEVFHRDGGHFRVVAVDVGSASREVHRWSQPLLAPVGVGTAALLARPIDGVLHVLARAAVEPGFRDGVEIGPTVQFTPCPGTPDPLFADVVAAAPARARRFDSVLSEEGGRFLDARCRYQVVEVGEEVPLAEPPGFCWVTPAQLADLLPHAHYADIQARTLVTCLVSLLGAGAGRGRRLRAA